MTSLIVMAGQSLLRAVISRELGAAELGLYYLAASLAFLPADIASQVVGKVTFPFYSRLQTDVRQASLAFRSILTSLYTLLIPAFALLIGLAPSLVEYVLGPRWEGTVPIIRVLALAGLIGLLGDMIVPVLQGTGRPDKILVIEGIQSSLLIVFVLGSIERYGVLGAALAWLFAVSTSQIVGIVFVRQSLPHPFSGLGMPIGIIVAISIVAAVTAISVDRMIIGYTGFILASTLGVTITGALLWVLERRYALGLSSGFVRAFPKFAAMIDLTHR